MIERTVLKCSYEPADFFEAAYTYPDSPYTIVISEGEAIITLNKPQNPVIPEVLQSAQEKLQRIFVSSQKVGAVGLCSHTHPSDEMCPHMLIAPADLKLQADAERP